MSGGGPSRQHQQDKRGSKPSKPSYPTPPARKDTRPTPRGK